MRGYDNNNKDLIIVVTVDAFCAVSPIDDQNLLGGVQTSKEKIRPEKRVSATVGTMCLIILSDYDILINSENLYKPVTRKCYVVEHNSNDRSEECFEKRTLVLTPCPE
ncbi:hypothetical protein CEXT_561771 [Caerostris extrusa]|uniref:Uncharacterized protein n=1 Tax=Caerostris extrusa TaxID=172846 RepID=A0AAV4RHV0_CAEEX|nr:hypothetical protein CEXT_561771 [Caerostris extrusa]